MRIQRKAGEVEVSPNESDGLLKVHFKARRKGRNLTETRATGKISFKEFKRLLNYFNQGSYQAGYKTKSGRCVKPTSILHSTITASSIRTFVETTAQEEAKQAQKVGQPLSKDENKPLRRQTKIKVVKKPKIASVLHETSNQIQEDKISEKFQENTLKKHSAWAISNKEAKENSNINVEKAYLPITLKSRSKNKKDKKLKVQEADREIERLHTIEDSNTKIDREKVAVTKINKCTLCRKLKQPVREFTLQFAKLDCGIKGPRTADSSHIIQDQWETNRSSLEFIRKLGQGLFAEVWEGLWKNTTPVAIKTLKNITMDYKVFLEEAQIMKKLRHPNIIQLYALCTLQAPIYIVMELMRNGSLLEYLQGKGKGLELSHLIGMATQIAAGMAYLESQNCVHRDLAARNILVDENNIVKIADFGLARLINKAETEVGCESLFPIKWTAPEAAKYKKYSTKSDVWSFGILLTEIVTYGRKPYPGVRNEEVLQQVQRGHRMLAPPNCPRALYNIMLECWRTNPSKRPTFKALHWQLENFFALLNL